MGDSFRASRMPTRGIALLVLAVACAPPRGAGADCIDYGAYIRWTGTVDIPGSAFGVAIQGSYAYVLADSSGLQVLDITNPSSPTIIGSVDTPGRASDVALTDTYAYVIDGVGLQVTDVSTPSSPALVGSLDTPGWAWDLALSWPYVYVTAGLGEPGGFTGLLVIDVTYPAEPALVDSLRFSAGGIALSGNYAYVGGGAGIQVYDISNRAEPVIMKTVATQHGVGTIDISEGYLYLAEGRSLEIMDITDPESPVVVGSLGNLVPTGGIYDIEVSGDFAYIAGYYGGGLQVIDVSDLSLPALVGTLQTPGSAQDVALLAGYVYVADGPAGLQVVDRSYPSSPKIVGSIDLSTGTHSVAIDGSHAYVLGSEHFWVIDIQTPSNPTIVTTLNSPNYYGAAIAVSGSYAYVTMSMVYSGSRPPGANDSLNVINISNPAHPVVAGGVALPYYGSGIAVSGHFAYIAAYTSLFVVDIQDPAAPYIAGSVGIPGNAFKVAVSGQYAYVAADRWLQVIDVSNPASPQMVGSLDLGDGATDVAVSGEFAFVVDFYFGLRTIDVSNPQSPQLISAVHTPGTPWCISISGQTAYVVDKSPASGLRVIDITNPALPKLVGMTDLPYDASGIAAKEDYVYLADGWAGFVVVSSQCETTVPVLLSRFVAKPEAGGVLLEWATRDESGISGFHVLRSSREHESFERLTFEPITGPYRFFDTQVVPGITYQYRLDAIDRSGNTETVGRVSATAGLNRSRLGPAIPNPFVTASTKLSFTLTRSGPVVLRILDISGRQVRVLVNEIALAGERSVIWDGRDDRGNPVSGGVYLYTIDSPGLKESRRVVKLR